MADAFDTMNQKAITGMPMEYRPRGLTDVKKQVSSIKGMLVLSTLALVVLTALNLGMVVAGVYITRQFKLATGPDGVVHLAKRGSNKIIHVGQSTHENLPLDSTANDDYFKKLDSVTMNFDAPKTPSAARRSLENHQPGHVEQLVRHTIHAKVHGFQRVHCPDCASGTQVKLSTHLGHFVVKDQAVIPLLDEKHFPGMDMKSFRESAAMSQGIPQAKIDAWNQRMMQNIHMVQNMAGNMTIPEMPDMPVPEMPDMPVPSEKSEVDPADMIVDIGFGLERPKEDEVSTQEVLRRRSLSGVFSGENHGSWDAGFHDSITGTKSHVTFDSHYDNNWKASGGSKTDIGASFHYDMNKSTGEASAGISHSWRQ